MKKSVLSILLLTACAGPTYVTKHGIEVTCESDKRCWSKADVETATVVLQEQSKEWWLPVVVDGTKMLVRDTDTSFPCESDWDDSVTRCRGQQWDKQIELAWRECMAYSAWAHEMGHLIQSQLYGYDDPYHKDASIFPGACPVDSDRCVRLSLVWRVLIELRDRLESCQELAGN